MGRGSAIECKESMMKARLLGTFVAMGLAVSALAPGAQAQTTADITATATVLTPLTVLPQADLDFGSVFPGTVKHVLPTDLTAGSFSIQGVLNAEITVTFSTLPTTLDDVAPTGNTIPISFAATDGVWNQVNNPSGAIFDPNTGLTNRLDAGTGFMYVFIGGSVSPLGTAPAGTYENTITLDAAYTGN
jgi:hypothetical protein